MSLVVRQFVYQHVCISARIQWLVPIILPRGLYLLSIVVAKRNLTVSIILWKQRNKGTPIIHIIQSIL